MQNIVTCLVADGPQESLSSFLLSDITTRTAAVASPLLLLVPSRSQIENDKLQPERLTTLAQVPPCIQYSQESSTATPSAVELKLKRCMIPFFALKIGMKSFYFKGIWSCCGFAGQLQQQNVVNVLTCYISYSPPSDYQVKIFNTVVPPTVWHLNIQNDVMFAVQSKEKSLLQNSRTFERCMSWPGSRRKQDDTLLSLTVPALCQEQTLLSAGLVARQPLLDDGIAPPTAQRETGTEPVLTASEFPFRTADASTAERYE